MKKLLVGLFVFSFLFIGFQVKATDEGCSSGVIFSSTTGARCPIIDVPIISTNNDTGCSNNEVYSSTTGSACPIIPKVCSSSITTNCVGPIPAVTPVIDTGCSSGVIFSSTTGARCPIVVGGDEDSHGCKGSAGYSWCGIKNKCLRTWEEKCEAVIPVEDKGCAYGQLYSLTTGQKCPVIDIPVNPVVIKNFHTAFLLISPNPSDQKTKDFLSFLENLKPKLEQSFKEATYNAATIKVDDIYVTKSGSENYLINPSEIQNNTNEAIKDLISKNGDKYDFINIFTTYDPKISGNYYQTVKNNVKNIGINIFDNSKEFGSSGKLLGFTFQGDILSAFKNMSALNILSNKDISLFGVGNLLHEIGHSACCHVGGNFIGNGDPSTLEIHNATGHLYEGLESPAKTKDILGTVPWLYNGNNNTYYEDPSSNDYDFRYHPITLYLMGLLPRDQYGTTFNIFNGGTDDQIKTVDLKKYKTVSVNDIIKFAGERSIENNIIAPIIPVVPIDTTKDNGCSNGQVYSSTTGQVCPTVPIIYINKDTGCNGSSKYSSTTGQVCTNYNGQNISSNNYLPNTATPIRRTLKLGIKGEDVKILQAFLNLLADGSFGPKTRSKVIEWQATNGLTPDGVVGPKTREMMK